MAGQAARKAIIGIDLQNVRGSLQNFYGRESLEGFNFRTLLERVVRREENMVLSKVSAYSGIFPESKPDRRAQNITQMDYIKDQGIETFANDLVRNAVGKWTESGIDLKLSADLLTQMLRDPSVTTVAVMSNDRDFEPTFALLQRVAGMINPPRQIECISLTMGGARGANNARRIPLTDDLVQASLSPVDHAAHNSIRSEAARRVSVDPIAALDATRHQGKSLGLSSKPVVREPSRAARYYLDLNSLGASAKGVLGRSHLDLDVVKMVRSINSDRGNRAAGATAYLSVHEGSYDPVDHMFSRNLASSLGRQGVSVKTIPFEYHEAKVAEFSQGPGADIAIKARVPAEKRVETAILYDVVTDYLSSKTDDVVLVSDRQSLWPISDVVKELGGALNRNQTTTNVHFASPPISGMEAIEVGLSRYESLLNTVNGLDVARSEVDHLVQQEHNRMVESVRSEFGSDIDIETEPSSITGNVVTQGDFWAAIKSSDDRVGLVRGLPMKPIPGVEYTIGNGQMRRVHAPVISRVASSENLMEVSQERPIVAAPVVTKIATLPGGR